MLMLFLISTTVLALASLKVNAIVTATLKTRSVYAEVHVLQTRMLMAFVMMSTIASALLMSAVFAMEAVLLKAHVIATETFLTNAEFVEDLALLTVPATVTVTSLTHVASVEAMARLAQALVLRLQRVANLTAEPRRHGHLC